MITRIAHTALLVREYDEAIDFYCGKLGFRVVEDTQLEHKRWVRLRSAGGEGSEILLSRAVGDAQQRSVGNQAGGRVLFFLHTDDFWRDFHRLQGEGVTFVREPKDESYGTVAVFEDLYGNLWDLLELKA